MKKSYPALLLSIVFTLAVGLAAGSVSRPDAWYYDLAKPVWTPPDWIFAPVWIILYTLMGVSLWLVWQRRAERLAATAIGLYVIQLILNAVWSLIFFGCHNPGLAFAEICLLWIAILATMTVFWRIRRTAAWLFLPYFLWVTFAAALNFSIWRLNMSGFA